MTKDVDCCADAPATKQGPSGETALGLCMNMHGHTNPPVEKSGAGRSIGASELRSTRTDGAPS
jgi:hypothetical protein